MFFPFVGWLSKDASDYKAENGFMPLVGSIGVDTSIANMVKPVERGRHSGLILSFHSRHMQPGGGYPVRRDCGILQW